MTRATPLMDRLIRRSLEHAVPLCVQFDLTYRCNERCVHCYLDHQGDGEMDTAEVRRVLQELSQAGALFLTFSGGEVFLRRDFFQLAAEARRLHFDVSLKTNGILIDAVGALRLKALGVRRAQISIYSADPAVHDAVTKVRGSFERSVDALRLLRQEGLRVTLACPLMRQNVGGYRAVLALAERLGVHSLLDASITPKIDGGPGPLEFRSPAADLLPVLADPVLNPRVKRSPTSMDGEAPDDALRDIPCSAGHYSCYISPYGDVYPCVQMPLAAGNLRRHSFEEIWHGSAKMRQVRWLRESSVPVCRACPIRGYCQRCPGLALIEGGDLLGPWQRACELAEQTARLAGMRDPVSAWHARRPGEAEGPVFFAVARSEAMPKTGEVTWNQTAKPL
jgi:radical SAM protein with 4Fe4S-binding SPASM domain